MDKSIFMDEYPLFSIKLNKNEIEQKTIEELVDYFKNKIEHQNIAILLTVFDQYQHTTNIGGPINPEIKAAVNIVFGFCPAIPNTKVMAVRPRSYGICELEDSFTIDFLKAPAETYQKIMEDWVDELLLVVK